MKYGLIISILVFLLVGAIYHAYSREQRGDELYSENLSLMFEIENLKKEMEANKSSSVNYFLDSAKGRMLRNCIEDSDIAIMFGTYVSDNRSCIEKFDNPSTN